MEEKPCTACGAVKNLSEFSKNASKKGGYQSQCKCCVRASRQANPQPIRDYQNRIYQENREHFREKRKITYKNNRESILEQKRQYYQENKDSRTQYNRDYYQINSDRLNEQTRKYREENREYLAEYAREYQRQNPEIWRASDAKRKALKISTATEDPWELAQISLFYGDCPVDWHVDHIIPLAKGGTHTLDNLQHLEAWMNLNKKDKHPNDWDDPRPISCRA